MSDGKPVFHDERRQRWSVTRRALEIGGAALAVLVAVLAVGAVGNLSLGNPVWPAFKPTIHSIKAKARPVKVAITRPGRKRRVAPR